MTLYIYVPLWALFSKKTVCEKFNVIVWLAVFGSWHENPEVPYGQLVSPMPMLCLQYSLTQENPIARRKGWMMENGKGSRNLNRILKKTGSGRKIWFLISNLFCSLIYSIKQQTITDELGKPFSQRRCRAWFEHYAGILMVQDCFIIFYIHLEVYIQMNNLSHSDSLLGHWAFCFVLSSAHTKIQFQPLTNVMILILWSRSY